MLSIFCPYVQEIKKVKNYSLLYGSIYRGIYIPPTISGGQNGHSVVVAVVGAVIVAVAVVVAVVLLLLLLRVVVRLLQ